MIKQRTKLKFTYDLPPSYNTAYPTNPWTKRRYPTDTVKKWKKGFIALLNGQEVLHTFNRCIIKMDFYFPDKRRRDVHSYGKIPVDCLVDAGMIKDDNFMINPAQFAFGYLDHDNPRMELTICDYYDINLVL